MTNSGARWRNSIFARLLLTFLIIIIPLYIGGMSIYSWGLYLIKKEMSKSMVSQVDGYLEDFESEVRRITNLQYDTMANTELNQLGMNYNSLNDLEKIRKIKGQQELLSVIRGSSKYIKNIVIYIPGISRAIAIASLTNQFSQEKYELLKMHQPWNGSQFVIYKGTLYMSTMWPKVDTATGRSPQLLMEVELSQQEMKKTLLNGQDTDARGALLMSADLEFSIFTDGYEMQIPQIKELIKKNLMNSSQGMFTFRIDGKPYWVVYSTSDYLDMILCQFVAEDSVLKSLNIFKLWFLLFSVAAFFLVVIFSFFIHRFIHKPLSILVKSFREVENGNLKIEIEHHHNDEFKYLYHRFIAMVEKLDVLFAQVYKQKILAQNAELKHLQSQINPHFLYNSFFNLHNMVIKGDYENLESFTKQLGTYFQFITRSAADEVPLEKEINHARTYAEIQARRFRNRITLQFDELPEQYSQIIVPRLIIQPIIENVFEHGLANKVSNGLVHIYFVDEHEYVKIVVEDNGDEITQQEIDSLNERLSMQDDIESTGIINIHKRVQLKFGRESGLRFFIGQIQGLRVELHIPNINQGKDEQDVQIADR